MQKSTLIVFVLILSFLCNVGDTRAAAISIDAALESDLASRTQKIPSITIKTPVNDQVFKQGEDIKFRWKSRYVSKKTRLDIGQWGGPSFCSGFVCTADVTFDAIAESIKNDGSEVIKNLKPGRYEVFIKNNSEGSGSSVTSETVSFTVEGDSVNDPVPGFTNYMFYMDLMLGSTGPDVVALQDMLITQGYLVMPASTVKGYFGSLTRTAVARWQAAQGISPANGYFGVVSRAKANQTQINVAPQKPDIGTQGSVTLDKAHYYFSETAFLTVIQPSNFQIATISKLEIVSGDTSLPIDFYYCYPDKDTKGAYRQQCMVNIPTNIQGKSKFKVTVNESIVTESFTTPPLKKAEIYSNTFEIHSLVNAF